MQTSVVKDHSNRCIQATGLVKNHLKCLFSRLTCLSCLALLTFLLCLTEEFTHLVRFRTHTSSDAHAAPRGDRWRRVTDSVYAYSAYWDDRPGRPPHVRVVSGARVSSGDLKRLKCLLGNDSSGHVLEEQHPTHQIITENHSQNSSAVFIMCQPGSGRRYDWVALVEDTWNRSDAREVPWMEVRGSQGVPNPRGIAVCVRPLFDYRDSFRVAEFVAYYEAVGVERVSLYDYDASREVRALVGELRAANHSVELLEWNLPGEVLDMWCLGQLASINDCIMRHWDTSDYVLVVDMDEFVTPRTVMALGVVRSIREHRGRCASFVMRSTVFCGEHLPDTLPEEVPDFVTQSRVWREERIYPFLVRSKYLVRPREVLVGGIHHAWEVSEGWEERFVPAGEVLVHHYRTGLCGRGGAGRVDPMARKYLNQLMRSGAVEVWKRLFKGKYAVNA